MKIGNAVLMLVICGFVMISFSWAVNAEEVPTTNNPLREFYEHNSYPSGWATEPKASENPEAFKPYEFYRIAVNLNDDGRDDYLLATPWLKQRVGDTYLLFISKGSVYTNPLLSKDGNLIIPHHRDYPFYTGRLEKLDKPAMFDFGFPGGQKADLDALYLVGDEFRVEQVAEFTREQCEDLETLDKQLSAKYKRGTLDIIPLAMMETVPEIKGNLDEYLKKREAATYADPLKDFCERHRKYFGEKRPAGQKVLQATSGDRLLLSTTTMEVGDLGYYWEAYTREGETFRWSRETVLQKPGDSVKRIPLP